MIDYDNSGRVYPQDMHNVRQNLQVDVNPPMGKYWNEIWRKEEAIREFVEKVNFLFGAFKIKEDMSSYFGTEFGLFCSGILSSTMLDEVVLW